MLSWRFPRRSLNLIVALGATEGTSQWHSAGLDPTGALTSRVCDCVSAHAGLLRNVDRAPRLKLCTAPPATGMPDVPALKTCRSHRAILTLLPDHSDFYACFRGSRL